MNLTASLFTFKYLITNYCLVLLIDHSSYTLNDFKELNINEYSFYKKKNRERLYNKLYPISRKVLFFKKYRS